MNYERGKQLVEAIKILVGEVDPAKFLSVNNLLIKRCSICNIERSKPVASYGSSTAKVLILDSNPSTKQLKVGNSLTFESTTSKILTRILLYLNINQQECFYSFAFRCKTADRSPVIYDRCSMWLYSELTHLNNIETIITLGEDAFHVIMGEGYPRLVDVYGSVYTKEINGKSYKVIPFMHPWFIMRNPEYLPKTIEIAKEHKM